MKVDIRKMAEDKFLEDQKDRIAKAEQSEIAKLLYQILISELDYKSICQKLEIDFSQIIFSKQVAKMFENEKYEALTYYLEKSKNCSGFFPTVFENILKNYDTWLRDQRKEGAENLKKLFLLAKTILSSMDKQIWQEKAEAVIRICDKSGDAGIKILFWIAKNRELHWAQNEKVFIGSILSCRKLDELYKECPEFVKKKAVSVLNYWIDDYNNPSLDMIGNVRRTHNIQNLLESTLNLNIIQKEDLDNLLDKCLAKGIPDVVGTIINLISEEKQKSIIEKIMNNNYEMFVSPELKNIFS